MRDLIFLAPQETVSLDAQRRGLVRYVLASQRDAQVTLRLQLEQRVPSAPKAADWATPELSAGGEAVRWARGSSWTWIGEPVSGEATRFFVSKDPVSLVSGAATGLQVALTAPEGFVGRVRLAAGDDVRGWSESAWAAVDPDGVRKVRRLLPGAFETAAEQDPHGPLPVLLEVMHGMLAPIDRRIRSFPDTLRPERTPDSFVPMLGAWLATGANPNDALPPNREWVGRAVELAQARGTSAGLALALDVATGVRGFEVRDGPGDFHMTVIGPAKLRGIESAIRHLIDKQRPAHMTWSLSFQHERSPE